jgi:hypothetical protein
MIGREIDLIAGIDQNGVAIGQESAYLATRQSIGFGPLGLKHVKGKKGKEKWKECV